MKKLLITCVLIILVSSFVYKFFFDKSIDASYSIEKESIEQGNFLKDKQAVMYFSTTADQDMDDKGISLAVFINDNGEADAFKMNGLELGSLTTSDNEVLLVDKNKIRLIGNTFKEFNMEKPQYTGERTGYLEKKNLYFTIFNTGISSDGGYDSNVVYGNEDGFNKGNIPYYISSSGNDQNDVVVLTHDTEKNEYYFRKVDLTNNDVKVQDIVKLKNPKNLELSGFSPVLSDEQFYYVVLREIVNETSEDIVLYRINKKTLIQDQYTISTYSNNKNLIAHIPYNIKNSAHLFNGVLYYANGLGEVYAFNTKTSKVSNLFTVKDAPQDGVRHNEELFFKDNLLYVVRHNEKLKEKYYIESYSLTEGKKIEDIKIKGLNDILRSIKGKSIYSYDFKMLK
ncbi:hypothetical protein QUF49_01285 [Fictibacillus sp. b24]|uniref:hypothetical protein n=1 Tax=Fictibacillus sp. b24 TaxID=3055863 RepID=UPI0025A1D03C|nr:hypothetical protein [Fictibacillus sp. b24]MDM5314602.1 hypothetical protein [Fictibacillus sp. b24]